MRGPPTPAQLARQALHKNVVIFCGSGLYIASFAIIGLWWFWGSYSSLVLLSKALAAPQQGRPAAESYLELVLRLVFSKFVGLMVRLVSGPLMMWCAYVWMQFRLTADTANTAFRFLCFNWATTDDADTFAHKVAIYVLLAQNFTVYFPLGEIQAACQVGGGSAAQAFDLTTNNADLPSIKLLLFVSVRGQCAAVQGCSGPLCCQQPRLAGVA
jgi:hypothetical protein